MASRTKQKEEARARRLAEEQARAEQARRQRRVRIILGTVVGALVVVVAAVLISSGGGSSSGGLQTGTKASATVSGVNGLLTGIPQSGNTIGNPKAPVTMTYYGDLKCPICRDFTVSGGFPQLMANEVRQGKVKVVYDAFCTATCNGPDPSEFPLQQVAALAAGKQNKFWQFTELFYHQQGDETTAYVTENYLQGLAKQIQGLNLTQWQTDRNDPNLTNEVTTQQNQGKQLGVNATPTLVFQGPKSQTEIQGAATYAQLQSAIKQVS
jgi:protein-disulfide isomerase